MSFLKSMQICLKTKDLMMKKFLVMDLPYGTYTKHSNGGFGLTADISNQRLRFANESRYIRVDLQTGKFYITKEGIIACRRIQTL
jgi:hypothetical protein